MPISDPLLGPTQLLDFAAPAVLADGYGQYNTKAILLMALFRSVGIRCRMHGFTIHRALQRGVVPGLVHPLVPVEIEIENRWIALEGFNLDRSFLETLQKAFRGPESLCGYGAGTDCLSAPAIAWTGGDTSTQKTGIAQALGPLRDRLYRHVVPHWTNVRARAIRAGCVPVLQRLAHRHEEQHHAA